MFDTKKLSSTPKDGFEAVRLLSEKEQSLIDALHIMQSIIDNPEPENKEWHTNRINTFLNKFKLRSDYCQCNFAMVQRDQETQIAYCFECKNEIKDI